MELDEQDRYAVFAEAEGHERPLLQSGLTFARLMDDVVVPYQSDETFFLDGAPVTPAKLRRIKILKLTAGFAGARNDFERSLTRHGIPDVRKTYGEQYHIRLEHDLREHSQDVTAQVIKAFNAAMKLFAEGIRALGA
jgi:hypothetical protein